MARLRIDLQDGFRGDIVAIRIDGAERYRQSGVTTNLASSLAATAEFDLAAPALVDVAVESRGLAAGTRIDAAGTPHLGVEVTRDGRLQLTPSSAGFRYL